VLVERGASSVDLRDGEAGDTVIMVQGDDTPGAFAARAMARLSILLSKRRAIREALVFVADGGSAELAAVRAPVARALALHMFATGGGTIVFHSGVTAEPWLRHQLLGLADVLLDETGGTSVSVGVRFGTSRAVPRPEPIAPWKEAVVPGRRPGVVRAAWVHRRRDPTAHRARLVSCA